MNEIYGHQWASQQGDEPNDTWVRGLSDITPQQFGCGLRALLDRDQSWPPNLVEFRQLCRGHDPDAWQKQCHRIVDPATLLDDKTTHEARCTDGLAAIRKLREEVGL